MDEKKTQDLCVTVAERVKDALSKGNDEEALRLIPALAREYTNRNKNQVRVITSFVLPLVQERFIEDQKRLAARVSEAVQRGDRAEAIALINTKTRRHMTIHDLCVDFIADCAGYAYDSFGREALFEMWRRWGEGTREWFREKSQISRDDLVEAATMINREHIGPIRIEQGKNSMRIILEPCGSGGRRLERERKGESGRAGVSAAVPEAIPLEVGAREQMPVYCTHCPVLFETYCRELNGRPLWQVNPPQKAGDTCVIEIFDI
ncbi:MAG: hypothetical protein HYX96_02015 [Chloroflexi bacterium]|nr:hypothetical protein [Chloroflexota bacterium]